MSERYINPFTDFGFKKLFGEEVNKDLLIDFLNQLLKEKAEITDLTYLRNEHISSTPSDRKAIFDLYCENQYGEKFIVELQKVQQKFFKDRSIYYSTFPIQEQAVRGDWTYELKAVYTVGIMDFIFQEEKDFQHKFHHEVKLIELETKRVFYDKLTFIYLEMPKFNKTEEELATHFEKWLYLLRNLASLQDRPKALQERIFQKVFEVAEIMKYNQEEKQAYHESLKDYRDFKNAIDTAVEKAVEQAVGLAVEKALEKRQIEIAITSLENGIDIKTTSTITGLSVAQIEKIWRERQGQ